ncbi:hypothetical protein J8F10_21635 [Gemmata sp. G18]|uniref:PNPLA domain-containing protein n=1 Tax=Gemmata palustris TaxID=2822762 RepID=A0ABS5BVX3_9BACT|nr:hypothetical protein [Gemmata palustris]MBP3957864.1 hypothetical protein [Gemmata palustris]
MWTKTKALLPTAASIFFIEAPFLTLLSLVMLLITLGVVDLELGLFHVVWWPSVRWPELEVFLNGVGVALLFATLAYLGYLIRARRDPEVVRDRAGLCLLLVLPFILLSMLPLLPASSLGLFVTLPDTLPAEGIGVRYLFGLGLVAGLVGFWGLVVAVSVNSPDQQFDVYLFRGTKAIVVTFAEEAPSKEAEFGPDKLVSLSNWKGEPFTEIDDVERISGTQFKIIFKQEVGAEGLYQFTVKACLPPVVLPAAVTRTLRRHQMTFTVFFTTPPAAFHKENIAGIWPEDGGGMVAVERVSRLPNVPHAYEVELKEAIKDEKRYYVAFTSNLPGVEGPASVSPVLPQGTEKFVLTFAAPPAEDPPALDQLVGVTDGSGRALPHPRNPTRLSPTQYEFELSIEARGRRVFAFAPGGDSPPPTTYEPGLPEEHDADPPVWLQANGLFALVLFFFCVPVGYSMADPLHPDWQNYSPLPIYLVTGVGIALALVTLVFATPRRVWSVFRALSGGVLPSNRPGWLRERPRAVREFGVLGFALVGSFAWGGATANLLPNAPTPLTLILLVTAFLVWIGLAWWLGVGRNSATIVRHGATTVLVVLLGVLVGAIFASPPQYGSIGKWFWFGVAIAVIALYICRTWIRSQDTFALLPGHPTWLLRLCSVVSAGLLAAVVVLATFSKLHKMPAAMSLSLLFVLFGIAYGALKFYADRKFYPLLIAATLLVAFVGGTRPYQHRLEALAPYYRLNDSAGREPCDRMFTDGVGTGKPDLAKYAGYVEAYQKTARDEKNGRLQLDNDDILGKWRDKLKTDANSKPPLVIVTTAGGASTSAIYTYAVLRELEHKCPDFHRHVRLITGASGGMFGAAHYRAVIGEVYAQHSGLLKDKKAEFRKKLLDELDAREKQLDDDFLSPIVQTMAFKDVPRLLGCPFGYADDRGARLESAWRRSLSKSDDKAALDGSLERTFAELRQQEQEHLLPSMVFTPMMIEDGRPLVISTLDLTEVTRTSLKTDPLRPYRALEFFKLFPEHGWSLKLSTAVRLNASFPWLSPGVSLPTLPPRRLVDAGYYDNYGMDTALAWIGRGWDADPTKPTPRPLTEYASRVLLVNIRPYMRDDVTESPLSAEELDFRKDRTQLRPTLIDPAAPLTGPPEGGNAARKTGMIARNNNLLDTLLQIPTVGDPPPAPNPKQKSITLPPVQAITFRGNSVASLNWTLPKWERTGLRDTASKAFDESTPKGAELMKVMRKGLGK